MSQRAAGEAPCVYQHRETCGRRGRTNRKHNFNADILREGRQYRWKFRRTLWLDSKDRRYRNFSLTNSLLHHRIMLEDTIQKPGDYLFWFSLGSHIMDQDGRFIGRIKSSRLVAGKNFPYFEMLDAKIASALKKIIQNSHFKKKVSLEEQKAQKEDRFPRGRQIAFMIYDYFWVTGATDSVGSCADLFTVVLSKFSWWSWYSSWLRWFIHSLSLFVMTMFGIRYKMVRKFIEFVHVKNTRVWSTQNRVGIVRHGNSSTNIDAQLSEIENDGEEKYRSETSIAKF